MDGDRARRRAEMPEATSGILERRSLGRSHRRLAALLRPGMRVLDAGCGTGTITRGIAAAVAPGGLAVGLDRHAGLLAHALAADRSAGLRLVVGDIFALPFGEVFDIATAARVLQWLAAPERALGELARVVRPGGRVVALDYNHRKIAWEPQPPESVRRFYDAFLRWRADAGMDNEIADRLPDLFHRVELREVAVTVQHEVARRGDLGFEGEIALWADVAATRGHQMVADGAVTEAQRAAAEAEYRAWVQAEAESQALYLLAVEGTRV